MDRLVDVDDREKYLKVVQEIIAKNLSLVQAVDPQTNMISEIKIDMNDVFFKPETGKISTFTNFSLGIGDG